MTQPGIVLGTAAYMSPEQAKGKAVDKRADVWALGCILYECLTGKRAFEGETITETLAAILKGEPDWQALPGTTLPNMCFVLRRCLEKDVNRRFRDAADIRIELEEARTNGEAAVRAKQSRIAWSIAIAFFIVALALALLHFRQAPVEAPQIRLEVVTPATSEPASLAISPDGRHLAFVASAEGREKLWLRTLDATGAQPLPGTEGAVNPFWSPDSRSIGFFAEGKLKRIDISGGQRQTLTSVHSGYGGTWNRDGVIVYSRSWGSQLYRIPASGGEPVAITRLDPPKQTSHSFPLFLPDGRHLLYFAMGSDRGIYLASLDSTETRRLIAAEYPGAYAAPGYLLFIREGTLFAQRFDSSNGDLAVDPVPIADSMAIDRRFGASGFSISETGMLAFRTAGGTGRQQLAWFDRAGNEVGRVGAPDENVLNLNLSPDGRRVAVNRSVQGNADIWLIETARGVLSRFTFDAGSDIYPIWSPDGTRILFSSSRQGIYNIYQKSSSGAGNEKLLLESSLNMFPNDVSSDGRFLLYLQADEKTRPDLWVLPLSGERKPFPFINTPFDERNGQFSANAQWVAYESNESGQSEIYVQSFPGPGGKRQVSAGGGTESRWRGDGKELFYIALDGKLMAVPIQSAGQTMEAGTPLALFQTRIVRRPVPQKSQYAVRPDGQRFLINMIVEEPTASPITIVANWTRALKN
jgi:Tol biopolymer transport system component